jgi:hypothetical protein
MEGRAMPVKPRYLSKGRFKIGSECPRKLYYLTHKDKYANQSDHDEFLKALAEGGHQVGALAQAYFPGGTLISTLDYDESVAQTNELLKQDDVIIYEPAFILDGFFIRVDVLVKEGNQVQLIEVKAKSYDREKGFLTNNGYPRAGQESYLDDVAFQTWVVRQFQPGWEVIPYLMLVDKDRLATVDGLHQLFRITKGDRGRVDVQVTEDLTAQRLGREILTLEPMAEMVDRIVAGTMRDMTKVPAFQGDPLENRAHFLSTIYQNGTRAPVELGQQCKQCEFRNSHETEAEGKQSGLDECWAEVLGSDFSPDVPLVTDIWNFRKTGEMLEQGIWKMADVPDEKLSPYHRPQVRVMLSDDQQEWVSPELKEELDSWVYPLHFLDFETTSPAIPFHKDMHPYESEGFQFSCHHVAEDGSITHDQYISTKPGQYPSYEFLQELQKVLGQDEGTILRYSPHENTILRHLRKNLMCGRPVVPSEMDTDDLIMFIDSITKSTGKEQDHQGPRNMVDMYPLVKNHYYHKRMGSKKSIKAVLDAMMSTSPVLKERYSKPLEFGTNLKGMVMHEVDLQTGETKDPYGLLPPVFADVEPGLLDFFEEDEKMKDGGAAMTAFAKMQFTEMGDEEREATVQALLKYCELDTLAMVMVWEGWGGRKAI